MKVEVVLALPERQIVIEIELLEGATVADALLAAGQAGMLGDSQVWDGAVGIFGKVVEASRVLTADDRVELYRPLQADPKQARRLRARLSAE